MTKPSTFNTLKSQRLSTPLIYTMRFETDRLRYHLTSEDQLFASVIDGILLRWTSDKQAAADFTLHLSTQLRSVVGTSLDIRNVQN